MVHCRRSSRLERVWACLISCSIWLELAQHFPHYVPHCKWRQRQRIPSTQFLLAASTPSHVFVQKKRAVESRLILWRVCVSLAVLTNHGASAGRRSDKVERWGKVTNVSEGEFALRSRLANSWRHTAYTVSLTTSSTVFALQICSATPQLQCGICGIGHLLYRSTTIVRVRMVRMSRMSSHWTMQVMWPRTLANHRCV